MFYILKYVILYYFHHKRKIHVVEKQKQMILQLFTTYCE